MQSFDQDTFDDRVEGRRWVKQYQENIIVIIKGPIYVIRKTQKGSFSAVISTMCWLSFSVEIVDDQVVFKLHCYKALNNLSKEREVTDWTVILKHFVIEIRLF